jgi:hypothetical protein
MRSIHFIYGYEIEKRSHSKLQPGARMKPFGFLLLFSGWGIVVAAIALLAPGSVRVVFVLSGIGVEVIGLVVVVRSHPLLRGERE